MMRSRNSKLCTAAAIIAGLLAIESYSAALASPLGMTRSAAKADDGMIEQVAARGGMAGARGGSVNRGRSVNRGVSRTNVNRTNVNRANVSRTNVSRTTVNRTRNVNVNRTVVRGGGRYGAWARPAAYRWRPGGAVAAGAAIGFVSAVTAAAWAGAAPGPGLCWYYTDPSRTQGFWDACP
jgi:hypothetical protein